MRKKAIAGTIRFLLITSFGAWAKSPTGLKNQKQHNPSD